MAWNQITLNVPDDLTDAVIGELSEYRLAGIWESEAAESGQTRLVAYFAPRSNLDDIEARLHGLFERLRRKPPLISRRIAEDRDWTEEWKKSYTSFPMGDDFFVIPSWENMACPPDRLPIRIDPGQAFGTGTHETTQLTIEALERWIEPDQTVLDVGTGSGILAIASRLLGARNVYACDIDPLAVDIARANIERNAEDNVWVFCGSVDAVKNSTIDLTIGNLTADLISALFAEFTRILKPHGVAVFSGILQEQREDVCETIARFGLTIHEEMTRGEWLAIIAEKHVA